MAETTGNLVTHNYEISSLRETVAKLTARVSMLQDDLKRANANCEYYENYCNELVQDITDQRDIVVKKDAQIKHLRDQMVKMMSKQHSL